jgi:hypothetical protein
MKTKILCGLICLKVLAGYGQGVNNGQQAIRGVPVNGIESNFLERVSHSRVELSFGGGFQMSSTSFLSSERLRQSYLAGLEYRTGKKWFLSIQQQIGYSYGVLCEQKRRLKDVDGGIMMGRNLNKSGNIRF